MLILILSCLNLWDLKAGFQKGQIDLPIEKRCYEETFRNAML